MAVYLQWLTHSWFGPRFIVFYPFIILTCWRWGSGAATVVAASSVLAALYNYINFGEDAGVTQFLLQCAGFILSVTLIIIINHRFRKINASLADREGEFRGLFEQSSVGMVISEPATGVITRSNQAFAEMLGYNADEIVGRTFMDLTHPEDSKNCRQLHADLSSGKIPGLQIQKRYLHKNGAAVWCEIVVNLDPVSTKNRTPGRILAVVQDITERKRLEEVLEKAKQEAEAASRSKDLFLATISHELRTPLTTIQMWAQMVQAGHVPSEKQARAIEAIEQNSRILNQLIGDILDFSGIRSGKFVLDRKAVRLDQILAEAVATVELYAQSRLVEVQTDLKASQTAVFADPMRLKQIVWNLLVNAIKFSNESGRVLVRSRCYGHECEIQVIDNGHGIAPEFLPKLFDQFTQADSSSIRSQGGVGLGLAIVRDLVQLHEGTVFATSQGLGKGATLTIRLPSSRQTAPTSMGSESKLTASAGLKGERILFVDDSPDTREVVAFALESMGAEVKTAESAKEALTVLPRYRPSVLVSDISMPDEDGFSLIAKVRALTPSLGGATPAIALTAHASAEDGKKAQEAGFQVHLSKPVDWKRFVSTILELRKTAGGPV